ncbi:MAG: DUF4175 family protein [Chloroflexota bacterium]
METYQEQYKTLTHRLRAVRRKETLNLLGEGLLRTLFVSICLLFAVALVETVARGDQAFRLALLIIWGLGSAAAFGLIMHPAILRALGKRNKPNLNEMALRVGERFPEVKDRLGNALQLFPLIDEPRGNSSDLAYAAFYEVARETEALDFDAIISGRRLRAAFIMFFIAGGIFLGSVLGFRSSLGESLYRIANWNQSFLPPAPFGIYIQPKSAKVLRGASSAVIVKATGQAPESVVLHIKEENQENYDTFTLKLDTGNTYRYELPAMKSSMTFYAEADWLGSSILTEVGTIKVIQKPVIKSLAGSVNPPSYAGQGSRSFDEQSADITALRGATVGVHLTSNKDLRSARIGFFRSGADSTGRNFDTTFIPMQVNGAGAQGRFSVQTNGSWFVEIYDKDGERNEDPVSYGIVVTEDGAPSISLLDPEGDVKLNEDAILPLRVAISDDYGFSSLKLFYRLAESKYSSPDPKFSYVEIPFVKNSLTSEVGYLWNLSKLGISPEDRFEFYVEVYDNDRIRGPKSARTQTLTARLPSMDEVLKTADASQDKIEKDLKTALKDAEQVKKEMEQLNRELDKKKPGEQMDWKQQKKADELLKKQQDINKRLDEAQQSLAETTKQLQQNNLLSPETMQKYMELQKLMKEVNSPELRKMQERMQQALQQMSPEQLKKAMENYKFDEEQFRKSIERSMKVLQRLQAEQKSDALTKRAEELSQKQDELRKQAENTNASDAQKRKELAEQQKRLAEELDKIKKEMNELEQLMKQIGEKEMPMNELNQAEQALNGEKTEQDMQQAAQDMQNANMQQAKNAQQRASQNLKNFAQKMKDMKKAMENSITKEAIRKMQKSINDLLEISKDQEDIKNKTSKTDYNSTQLPELARQQQQQLEALANVANGMMELAEKSFAVTPEMGEQIGRAMQGMQEAISKMADRRPSQAAQSQGGAMQSLNQAASQMKDMLGAMKQQGNGSCPNPGGTNPSGQGGQGAMSFSQRLQQAAGQQQALNQQMQQMMQQGQGGENGSMSQEARAKMGRLSKEQGSAQKSVEELAREQKQFGGEDRKTLGDLNKIAQEMKEVMQDIESGRVTPETLKKQERILSRLLDANKSLNERDMEKQREAKSGKFYNQKSPEPLNLSTQEGKRQAMQELLRSLKQGYSKDYEQMIRLYLESIQSGN